MQGSQDRRVCNAQLLCLQQPSLSPSNVILNEEIKETSVSDRALPSAYGNGDGAGPAGLCDTEL